MATIASAPPTAPATYPPMTPPPIASAAHIAALTRLITHSENTHTMLDVCAPFTGQVLGQIPLLQARRCAARV